MKGWHGTLTSPAGLCGVSGAPPSSADQNVLIAKEMGQGIAFYWCLSWKRWKINPALEEDGKLFVTCSKALRHSVSLALCHEAAGTEDVQHVSHQHLLCY